MILHIVKKDWKLLWPLVALVAALHGLIEWTRYGHGWFAPVPPAPNALELLEPVALVAWVALVVALVHADRIPGSRQDWLVRPIRRADLVLAKLAFLIVLLHGPLLAAQAALLIGFGFPIPESLAAAGTAGAARFVSYTLPVFALAAVTRNTIELLIAGVVVGLLALVGLALVFLATGENPDDLQPICAPACGQGFDWLVDVARAGIVLTAALAATGLQYFKRHATFAARGIIAAAAVCVFAPLLLPTALVFRAQQALSASAESAGEIEIALDRAAPPTAAEPRDSQRAAEQRAVRAARLGLAGSEYSDAPALREDGARRVDVSVPLEISGLPADTILWADTIETRLVDAAGDVVHRGLGGELDVHASTSARTRARHVFSIPADTIDTYGNRDLRLEVHYRLTLLVLDTEWSLRAVDGAAGGSGDTLCAARAPAAASGAERAIVRFRCVTAGRPPSCYTVTLGPRAADAPSTALRVCNPSYGPYGRNADTPVPFRRFGIDIPAAGGTAAVDGTVVRYAEYEASGHFAKRLAVTGLRLADHVRPAPAEPAQ